MADQIKLGLLLPHFGATATREHLLTIAELAEDFGFDSLWVRDHLIYRPHGFEEADRTFIDAFVALSLVGARVGDMTLGTAVTIPHRHPLHLAQLYANLDYVVEGDVIAGFGLGGLEHEFEIADIPFDKRSDIHRESMEIMRRIWNGQGDFDGEFYSFENAEQYPLPEDPLPIWIGGTSPKTVQRVKDYGDGWLIGRINLPTLKAGIKSLHTSAKESNTEMPTVCAVKMTSIDEDPEKAIEKADLESLLEGTEEFWVKPESGEFKTIDDIEGMYMAGSPEDIVEDVRMFHDIGVDHLIFDLRQRYDELEYCIELLGTHVFDEVR